MPFKEGEIPEGATPFEKGKSGNPNGRPLGVKNRSTIAKQILDTLVTIPEKHLKRFREYWPELPDKVTGEELITYAAQFRALKRDMSYKILMDSRYGAPKQEVDHTSNGEKLDFRPQIILTGPDPANSEKDVIL